MNVLSFLQPDIFKINSERLDMLVEKYREEHPGLDYLFQGKRWVVNDFSKEKNPVFFPFYILGEEEQFQGDSKEEFSGIYVEPSYYFNPTSTKPTFSISEDSVTGRVNLSSIEFNNKERKYGLRNESTTLQDRFTACCDPTHEYPFMQKYEGLCVTIEKDEGVERRISYRGRFEIQRLHQ